MPATRPWHARRYLVIDIEGNGLRQAETVELAAVPIVDGVIGTSRSWLVRPDNPITWQAQRVHRISNAMVEQAPSIEELRSDITELLAENVIVGHNVRFDIEVLTRQLPGLSSGETVDTLRLARRLLPNAPSYRLGPLTEWLELTENTPAGLHPHRAGYDVVVTARLLVHLATKANGEPRTVDELSALTGSVTTPENQLGLFD